MDHDSLQDVKAAFDAASAFDDQDRDRHILLDILNSSPVCLAIVVDSAVRFVSPFMSEFLGIRVGEKLRSYFVDEQSGRRLRQELVENRTINWHPVVLRTKFGDIKEMLANMYFIDYYGTEAVMVWLIDVTQIRKVEAELRLARDAAEASAKAKSEFLANMSHEIRTPMNAILGMTHLALRTELTPKQTEYVEGVEQSAKLLLRIINDILDFSKIEAGRMVMEYHEFSVREVLEDLRSVVAESARQKFLPLNFDVHRDVPQRIMGDSVRLRQVLLNLTNNAIKFTGQGAVRVAVRPLDQDGLSVELEFSVQDTGIGMTPEQIRMLFKPFSQADSSTTRKYGGTGLGLAISKSLVEMMKGGIVCQSELGRGTTFTFTGRFGLPLEDESLQDFSEIRTGALLLGDRTDSLKEIRHYLELFKCRIVSQCDTNEEFTSFLAENREEEIDFIVFDFDELIEKGLPAFEAIRKHFDNQLPPIAVAAHPDVEFVIKEMNLPVSQTVEVIQEPVIVSELFNIIMGATARKKEKMLCVLRQNQEALDVAKRPGSLFDIPEKIRGSRILLAEDNRINQIVASEMLQMEGFNVDIAENGGQAVKMCRENKYDLVLMDIQMPEMDGLEATRQIRSDSRFYALPILAMTAHAMTGDREVSLEAGMNDHITKPIDPKLLFGALVKWIKR